MLDATTPLNGFSAEINDVLIKELSGRALVSLAVPLGGESKFKAAMKKALKIDLPPPGKYTAANASNGHLIWTAPEQYFYFFEEVGHYPEKFLKKQLNGTAYVTDQSDAFAILSVSGDKCLSALERICPINLSSAQFPVGSATRTMMEHLGVLIMRTGEKEFVLMSAASSAASFLHAVETSARNID